MIFCGTLFRRPTIAATFVLTILSCIGCDSRNQQAPLPDAAINDAVLDRVDRLDAVVDSGWDLGKHGLGCPPEGMVSNRADCGCVFDSSTSVLLQVGNSYASWTAWTAGNDPVAAVAKVKWTVLVEGWSEPEVLVLAAPRVSHDDELVRRMVRLPAEGSAQIGLELLDDGDALIAEGTWTHELVGGQGWTLLWAWDVGDKPQIGSGYNWKKFEPTEPHCTGPGGECLGLWLGTSVRDPVADECINNSELRVQPIDGQTIEEALGQVHLALDCCEPLQISQGTDMWGSAAGWVTIAIPDPSLYLGIEFRLYCAQQSGLKLWLAQHVSNCLY